MSPLAPNLFVRRFQDLIEIGRARVRPLAPDWTDHNAHDPGITLMELLAWVAEAQLYSVSRVRRDERTAYAALLGLASAGTRGATGLIWSDRLDPKSPAATFTKSVVIPTSAVIHMVGDDSPTFRPTHRLLWASGGIQRLEARSPNGRTVDLTAINARGGPAFLPFGESADRRATLALTFVSRDQAGLFGSDRQGATGALWPIGVLAAPPTGGAVVTAGEPYQPRHSALSALLVSDDLRVDVPIVWDSTQGMLTTGALLLDLDGIPSSPREFTLELRSPRGLPRPPRVLRIEPSVIPIRQGRSIDRELHVATGLPDWSVQLDVPGLRFNAGDEPLKVEVAEPTGLLLWNRGRLSDSGPEDRVYELDVRTGEMTFGNGINGRIPPEVAQVLISYSVSDGQDGNVGRNRPWRVEGFDGAFGVNVDPIVGGAAPFDWIDERREARRRSRDEHALISATDLIGAAKALPLLEVVRGWVVVPAANAPRTGVVTLVAMRSRPDDHEPERIPETRLWLEAIRRQLLPRIPIATRLAVVAPHYVEFSLQASVECSTGRDPVAVKNAIDKALRRRLALVELQDGTPPREPGVPVTLRDVRAWIRAVDGVKRVVSVELRGADGRTVDEIALHDFALPRWQPSTSTIDVARPAAGGGR